ncbi:hypothetical protein HanIR_Chr17g0893061 [Helianthus annuus]|nr:hypothetical protein HanIR_Chr17g0893061 [Helianthus annuus]
MMMVKVMFIGRGDGFAMKTPPPSSHKPSAVNSTTSPPFLLHPITTLLFPYAAAATALRCVAIIVRRV